MAQPLSCSFEFFEPEYTGPYANLRPISQDIWNTCLRDFDFTDLCRRVAPVNRSFCLIAQNVIHYKLQRSFSPFDHLFKPRSFARGAAAYQFAKAQQMYCSMKAIKGEALTTIQLPPTNFFAQLGSRLDRLNQLPEIQQRTVTFLYFEDITSANGCCSKVVDAAFVSKVLNTLFREKKFKHMDAQVLERKFQIFAHFAELFASEDKSQFVHCIGELFKLERIEVAEEILKRSKRRSPWDVVEILARQVNTWRATFVFASRLPPSEAKDQSLLYCLQNYPAPSSEELPSDFFRGISKMQSQKAKRQLRDIFALQLKKKLKKQKTEEVSYKWSQIQNLATTAYPQQTFLIEENFARLIPHVHFHENHLPDSTK